MKTVIDLEALAAEAQAWLLAQRCDRALDAFAIAHFRSRFCLPAWLIEAIEREEAKER